MKRVHNRSPSPTGAAKPSKNPKKRKNSPGESGSSKKSPTTGSASVEKPRAPGRSLSEQILHDRQQIMSTMGEISDLDDPEAIETKIEKASQNLKMMARALQQMKPGQRIDRTISQQSG